MNLPAHFVVEPTEDNIALLVEYQQTLHFGFGGWEVLNSTTGALDCIRTNIKEQAWPDSYWIGFGLFGFLDVLFLFGFVRSSLPDL